MDSLHKMTKTRRETLHERSNETGQLISKGIFSIKENYQFCHILIISISQFFLSSLNWTRPPGMESILDFWETQVNAVNCWSHVLFDWFLVNIWQKREEEICCTILQSALQRVSRPAERRQSDRINLSNTKCSQIQKSLGIRSTFSIFRLQTTSSQRVVFDCLRGKTIISENNQKDKRRAFCS